MITLIITLGILNAWLIWYSLLIIYTLQYDRSFKYIILNKMQLLKYWLYSSSLVLIGTYIFIIRLNNQQLTVNIYNLEERFWTLYYSLSYNAMLIIVVEISLIFLFWILFLKAFHQFIKNCLIALFMYYRQYDFFCNLCSKYIFFKIHVDNYLVTRVRLFTHNEKIFALTSYIWPGLYILLEPKIFACLLPYLIIFDYMTQDGNISKFFIILPWYYIYLLVRAAMDRFREIFKPEITQLSMSVYKSIQINEKIIRWVEIPENYKV